jgi:hypothetical protein
MIRIGHYDAFDKWEIVCRNWRDPSAAHDPCVGRYGAAVLTEWGSAARIGGERALREYLRLRAIAPEASGDFCGAEVSRFSRGSVDRVDEIAIELVSRIKNQGYEEASVGDPVFSDRLREVFKAGALERLRWTEDAEEIPSLTELRAQANIFPTNAVRHKRRALCIFSALFFGRADVIHVHDAQPDAATLVDADDRVHEMRLIYPADWRFIQSHYEDFLREATTHKESYDLIVCDEPEFLARKVVWDYLPTIMSMCSDTFCAPIPLSPITGNTCSLNWA